MRWHDLTNNLKRHIFRFFSLLAIAHSIYQYLLQLEASGKPVNTNK